MRKIAMIVGLISVLATSANAGYWSSSPNASGGYNYQYNYQNKDRSTGQSKDRKKGTDKGPNKSQK